MLHLLQVIWYQIGVYYVKLETAKGENRWGAGWQQQHRTKSLAASGRQACARQWRLGRRHGEHGH